MRVPPVHLVRRLGRKGLLTALGMSLCVAFCVGSFAVVQGLERSTYQVGDSLRDSSLLVARPGLAPFEASDDRLAEGLHVLVVHVQTSEGTPLSLIAFEGPGAPDVAAGQLRPGADLRVPERVRVAGAQEEMVLERGAVLRLPAAPPGWAVVAPMTARALDAALAGNVSYVLLSPWTAQDQAALRAQGFVAEPTPAIIGFFQGSAREIAVDLALVVLSSAALVALLSYEFMHMEVRERRREIGIWRAVGLQRRDVLGLLALRAGMLSALAAVLGGGGAFALLLFAARASGAALLSPHLTWPVAVAIFGTFVLAGLAGGLVPAIRVARAPAREALEAAP